MRLNPDRLTVAQQRRVVDWLDANGCRDIIALEPIIIRGNVAEYVALCRRERVMLDPLRDGEFVWTRRRRLRVRTPRPSLVPACDHLDQETL